MTGITARQRDAKNKIRSFILRRHISYLRSKSHPAESRQITYSLFTLTSCFQKILTKWKRQVKSEKVISKKSSFLRMRIFWRREWDSNPRDVAVKRFSRPPRYDRFDTSPCVNSNLGNSRNHLSFWLVSFAFLSLSLSDIRYYISSVSECQPLF